MKTSLDPRHKNRQSIIQHLFTYSFQENQSKNKTVRDIISHLKTIDGTIEKLAPEFPLNQINKIDLAILRLAVYELLIQKDTPAKVAADEGIELAKEFGGENSPVFISGALGKLIKEMKS